MTDYYIIIRFSATNHKNYFFYDLRNFSKKGLKFMNYGKKISIYLEKNHIDKYLI